MLEPYDEPRIGDLKIEYAVDLKLSVVLGDADRPVSVTTEAVKKRPKVQLKATSGSTYSSYNTDGQTKSRIHIAVHLINQSPLNVPCNQSTIVRMAVSRFIKGLQEACRKLETLPTDSAEWKDLRRELRYEVMDANNAGDGVRRK